jgi:hypothetical protein
MESRGWWVVSWIIDEVPTNVYEAAVSKIEGMKARTELDNNGVRAIGDLVFRGLHHDSVVAEFRSAVLYWLAPAATMPAPQAMPPGEDLVKKYPLAFEAPLPTRPPLRLRTEDELDAMHIPGVDRDSPPHIQMDQIDMALTEVYQVPMRVPSLVTATNRLDRKSMPIWRRSTIYLRNLSSHR